MLIRFLAESEMRRSIPPSYLSIKCGASANWLLALASYPPYRHQLSYLTLCMKENKRISRNVELLLLNLLSFGQRACDWHCEVYEEVDYSETCSHVRGSKSSEGCLGSWFEPGPVTPWRLFGASLGLWNVEPAPVQYNGQISELTIWATKQGQCHPLVIGFMFTGTFSQHLVVLFSSSFSFFSHCGDLWCFICAYFRLL